MVNGRLMRRYYYGMLLCFDVSGPHMRNDLSASFLRPQQCRMGRAKRNPSLLGQATCCRCPLLGFKDRRMECQ